MHFKDKQMNRSMQTKTNIEHGIVYKKVTGSYEVRSGERMTTCTLCAQMRREADLVAVGDQVAFSVIQPGKGTINAVLPRENRLARRSSVPMPGAHAFEQVIVANVDQVVPVFAAASPAPKWNMLDRYLVTAESLDLPALVVITKLDLVKNDHGEVDTAIQAEAEEYRRIGYPVILVSAQTGEGLEELKATLKNRISVFLGKSGVGKSSLLNALQPGLGLRVNNVGQGRVGKGRHTTTHMEMFPLEIGGAIVDTPGVREFGLWDVDEDDMALYYPEMRPFIGQCKFGSNCRHDEEPGCAVRKAVMNGHISPRRYQSYMRLKEEA
jgi:ribosome biogenesis GTPase